MIQKISYPNPGFARSEWLNLNGNWEFSLDTPTYDKIIQVPYSWGSPLSGIETDHGGTAYYRRTVRWNPLGERIILRFGAVDYECAVFVNGTEVCTHRGGYAPFEADVTDVWNRSGDNEIIVRATDTDDPYPQTYGKQGYGNIRGIWQTVWLETRPVTYIQDFFIRTKIDGTVTIDLTLSGASSNATVTATFPTAMPEAGCVSVKVTGSSVSLTFRVNNPYLWTPENPFLYKGELTLSDGNRTDIVSTYFGIREIGTDVFGENHRRYITLNGKPYFLNGVLDQSFNPNGYFTLPSDDDCREEILRMKRIGLNMARIHIKAEEPLKLYWADRLGLLIMEDIPCFWGEPTMEVRTQYETEMEQQILRDRNHPSVFYWVVFNETWGLYTKVPKEDGSSSNVYLDDTARWVESCWHRVKELDPTRLVEDNSVCHGDHTITDVNTWHFYSNGYSCVRDTIDNFCKNAYVGSSSNYKEGYVMTDVPCMNSECGNVWGVTGNAGDSDISWQYKYMINEFRRQDLLCGFVFTEFHDVINEFNGYYKINNDDKDFGYSEYGTSLRDIHAQDYLGADFPPMMTVHPGDAVTIPMFGSSFSNQHHGKTLLVKWQLHLCDPVSGDSIADSGNYTLPWTGYGTFHAGEIPVQIPEHDGVAVLTWTLLNDEALPIMHNSLLFDIDGGRRKDALVLEPEHFTGKHWIRDFTAQAGNKLNGLGTGEFTAEIHGCDIPGFYTASDFRIVLEAATRPAMTHDLPKKKNKQSELANYMLGYRCDPGENPNTFSQTDSIKVPGTLEILLNDEVCAVVHLPDAPADSRGALSHHYQVSDTQLDEAGSYGTLCDIRIPSPTLFRLQKEKTFTLTLRTPDKNGLSIFGRKSGRYGIGVVLRAEN